MSSSQSTSSKSPPAGVFFRTPIISNKKSLQPELSRSKTLVTSITTSSLTSSTSSMSSKSAYSHDSPQVSTRSPSSYHSPQRSWHGSMSAKTLRMGSSPRSIMDLGTKTYPKRNSKSSRRKFSSRAVDCEGDLFKDTPLGLLSAFIGKATDRSKACIADKCAGEDLDDIYEEEYTSDEDEESYYSGILDTSVESESFIESSLGTQSVTSSQASLLHVKKMRARRALMFSSNASRSNSLIDSTDGNSLIDSADEVESLNEESEATVDTFQLAESILSNDKTAWADITQPTAQKPSTPPRDESRRKVTNVLGRYYKKLSTVGIQLFLNEHHSTNASAKRPGLLHLRPGQIAEHPRFVWVDSETKKSNIFGLLEISSIRKLNSVDEIAWMDMKTSSRASSKDKTTAACFCVSLKDDSLLFFEAIDETQMTRVVQALKGIVARFHRQLIVGNTEQMGLIPQNKEVEATGTAFMSSLTDDLVVNCFADHVGTS